MLKYTCTEETPVINDDCEVVVILDKGRFSTFFFYYEIFKINVII